MASACFILSEWFESVALSLTKPPENELRLICLVTEDQEVMCQCFVFYRLIAM